MLPRILARAVANVTIIIVIGSVGYSGARAQESTNIPAHNTKPTLPYDRAKPTKAAGSSTTDRPPTEEFATSDISHGRTACAAWTSVATPAPDKRRHAGHTGHTKGARVGTVGFSPNEELALTGAWDATAILWDVRTGKQIRRFLGHTGPVLSAVFSPNGQLILTASSDQTARIWRVDNGLEFARSRADSKVVSASFSPDGAHLAIATAKGSVCVFKAVNHEFVWHFQAPNVKAIQFSKDSSKLFAGGEPYESSPPGGRTVYAWDIRSGTKVIELPVATSSIAISPTADRILTAGSDLIATLRKTEDGTELIQFKGHTDKITSLAITPNGKAGVTAGRDGTVRIWTYDEDKKAEVARIIHIPEGIAAESVAISSSGRFLLSGDANGNAYVWDYSTGSQLSDLSRPRIMSLTLTNDRRRLLLGGHDGSIRVWDIANGRQVTKIRAHKSIVWEIRASSRGSYIVSIGNDDARIWDARTLQQIREIRDITNPVWSADTSTDERFLVTGHQNGDINVWDIATGNLEANRKGKGDRGEKGAWLPLLSVRFSPDDKFILAGGREDEAELWSPSGGWTDKLHYPPKGSTISTIQPKRDPPEERHGGMTIRPAWSPHFGNSSPAVYSSDARMIAQASFYKSEDGGVLIWQMGEGRTQTKFLRELSGHYGKPIKAVSFSLDGRRLLTGGQDGNAQVWSIDDGQVLKTLKGHTDIVTDAAFVSNSTVVTASYDGTIRFWDVNTGDEVACVKVRPSTDHLVKTPVAYPRWKKPRAVPSLRIETGMHTAVINNISVSADDRLLVTASDDKTVRVWSIPEGKPVHTLRPPGGRLKSGKIWSVAVSPDGRFISAGGENEAGVIFIFDAYTGVMLRTLDMHTDLVADMHFSQDSKRLAVGGRFGIRIWDTNAWSVQTELTECPHPYGLAFDAIGRLAASSPSGYVCLYDEAGKLTARAWAQSGRLPYRIAFSPNGRRLAVGYHDSGAVDVFDGSDLKHFFSVDTGNKSRENILSVAWSKDGETLFGAGGEEILRWSDSGRGPVQVLTRLSRECCLGIRPFGKRGLAFGAYGPAFGLLGDDGLLRLVRPANQPDMKRKLGDGLAISRDATRVRFGLDKGAKNPWIFDLNELSFQPSPVFPSDLHQPDVSGLQIEGWHDAHGTYPRLAGQVLPEIPGYGNVHFFSLAIAPGGASFVIGTEWHVVSYTDEGEQRWNYAGPAPALGVNASLNGKVVVVAYDDGTIRWHRQTDGQELLALFVQVSPDVDVTPHRWVLWTPKGYYTASVGGENLIGWHVNRGWGSAADFFPVSKFRDTFYRPDIVGRVLADLDEEKAITEANLIIGQRRANEDVMNRRPPVIRMRSPMEGSEFMRDEVTVEYSVRSPSGLPIKRVFAQIDGRPVQGAQTIDQSSDPHQEIIGTLTLKLPRHDIKLSIIAESEQVFSEPASVDLLWLGNPSLERAIQPRLFALIVGVANYVQDTLKLKGFPTNDADDIAAQLKAQEGPGRAFEKVNATILKDAAATRDNILHGLQWLLDNVKDANDIALMYFSGHGTTEGATSYLLPVSADRKALVSTGLNKQVVLDVLRSINGKVIFFIDACYAAEGMNRLNTTMLVNEFMAFENGITSFTSSAANETSSGIEGRNSHFTRAVIEGLRGRAARAGNQVILTDDLNAWLQRRVPALSQGRQTPAMTKSPLAKSVPLAVLQ
jgi:WD40 repeat protein